MTTITNKQYENLVKAIYDLILKNEENNLSITKDCEAIAEQLIFEWMGKEKIELA